MKKEVGRRDGLGKNGGMGLTWEQAGWRLASGLWCQLLGGVKWGGGLSARETDLGWPKEVGFFYGKCRWFPVSNPRPGTEQMFNKR